VIKCCERFGHTLHPMRLEKPKPIVVVSRREKVQNMNDVNKKTAQDLI